MRKYFLVALISFVFLGCSNPKSNSSSSAKEKEFIANSCHTCFELDKTKQANVEKQNRINDIFVINDEVKFYDLAGKEIGSVVRGLGGKKVKELGDKTLIKVNGFVKEGDTKTLYANNTFEIPVLTFLSEGIKANEFEIAISNKDLSANENQAWTTGEFAYYDNCSMCHAAHSPKEHTVREWEFLYSSMKAFAMPNEHDDKYIWQYLQAHAKDSYALDDIE